MPGFRAFLIAFTTFFLFFPDRGSGSEILLTSSIGQVDMMKKESESWKSVSPGIVLSGGDTLRTGEKSQARCFSSENRRIIVREKTSIRIEDMDPSRTVFKQDSGKALYSIAKLNPGQTLRVVTPSAVVSVRGTEFLVAVGEDQSTVVEVFEGVVTVSGSGHPLQEISVPENQESVIRKGLDPALPELLPLQDREELKSMGSGIEKDMGMAQNYFNSQRVPPQSFLSETKDRIRKELNPDRKRIRSDLKNIIFRESNLDLGKGSFKSSAVAQHLTDLRTLGRTYTDSQGTRVRQEDYITRPSVNSLRMISLNKTANGFSQSVTDISFDASLSNPIINPLNNSFLSGILSYARTNPSMNTSVNTVLNNGSNPVSNSAVSVAVTNQVTNTVNNTVSAVNNTVNNVNNGGNLPSGQNKVSLPLVTQTNTSPAANPVNNPPASVPQSLPANVPSSPLP